MKFPLTPELIMIFIMGRSWTFVNTPCIVLFQLRGRVYFRAPVLDKLPCTVSNSRCTNMHPPKSHLLLSFEDGSLHLTTDLITITPPYTLSPERMGLKRRNSKSREMKNNWALTWCSSWWFQIHLCGEWTIKLQAIMSTAPWLLYWLPAGLI